MSFAILDHQLRFPSPQFADAEGLVAVGGDLSVPRLLLAYRSGIFPWTVDPITWWSPDPRAVFRAGGLSCVAQPGPGHSEGGIPDYGGSGIPARDEGLRGPGARPPQHVDQP